MTAKNPEDVLRAFEHYQRDLSQLLQALKSGGKSGTALSLMQSLTTQDIGMLCWSVPPDWQSEASDFHSRLEAVLSSIQSDVAVLRSDFATAEGGLPTLSMMADQISASVSRVIAARPKTGQSSQPLPPSTSLSRKATSPLAEKWSLAAANAKSCADQVKHVADIFKRLAVDAVENISTHMTQRCAECAQQAASLAQAASQATGANMAKLAAESADAAEGAALYAEFLISDFDKAITQDPAAEQSGGVALFGDPVNKWQKLQQVANELFELCIVTETTNGCKVSRGSVSPGGGDSRMLTGDTMLLNIPAPGFENLPVQFKRFTIREARGQLASEGASDTSFNEWLDRIVGVIGAYHAGQQRAAQSRCFIATAACSTAHAPDVVTLRQFREVVLCQSFVGRLVSSIYEIVSPPVAALIGRSEMLKLLTRYLVVRPVAYLAKRQMGGRSRIRTAEPL